MNKKICHECGTENEQEYLYCKNCGADLNKTEDNTANSQTQYTPPNYNSNYNQDKSTADAFIVDSIDGIPMEQIGLYVGKKSDYYCRKFSRMELTMSKISWHWPAAVLGFLFGPFGSAIWCFYRKMYKVAFILVAIGILLSGITCALTYNDSTLALEEIIKASRLESVEEMLEALENIDRADSVGTTAAEYISDFVGTVTAI